MRRTLCFAHSIIVLLVLTHDSHAGDVDFDSQIRPLLSDRCFRCHGPDAAARKADLRLDLESSATEAVIVRGKPAKSELIRRITNSDPDVHMPPPDSKLELSTGEIELLRRWIAEGAVWKKHWAFVMTRKPALPKVKNAKWCRNEIDRFILRKLDEAGLAPAPSTARERLIRRLSFDLTGLPPTLAEIDAFVNDRQSGAYERVVDRLLKNKHYGERMTADWLDLARYSDTYGYQVDRDRFVWPWRDWVVRAFNTNMPYDQFVTEQLAGDLLPNSTDDQILATTFNRLHPQKVEGGSTPEEFRIEYVSDRTQTFATAFLGLTMECCRCHDHKYDPLSQREYYQISAFFDNIAEAGLYSYFTSSVPTPTLALVDAATEAKIAGLRREVMAVINTLSELTETRRDAFNAWRQKSVVPETLIPGRIANLDFEGEITGGNSSVPGRHGKAVKLSGDDGIGMKVGNFRRSDPFSISLWMNTPDLPERAVVFHRSRAWTDAGSRGYQLLIENGRLSASLIHFWPGNAIRIRTRKPLPVGSWQHVVVTWNGFSDVMGLRIFLNGKIAECDVVRDNLTKNITGGGGDNITIGQRFRDRGFKNGLIDEFQVFERQLTAIEVAQLFDGSTLSDAMKARNETDSSDEDALYHYYLMTIDPAYRKQLDDLRKKRRQLNDVLNGLREIMVMREDAIPRQTYLLKRGAYDAPTEPVQPGTPAILPIFPKDAPRNRLGLARWLTQPENPLAGRVAVNRFWQIIFGEGLVRTPEDFGRQGKPPTHPELLDWLTHDFVSNGWNTKRLLKQIVMSSTYRQSSDAAAESVSRDPQNRLLSRSLTHRLPAEMLRDNALAASGLLVRKTGGPPVKPYELEVSFKPAKRDKGEGLYRRSLYTYWKRTGPAPVMRTLDASKRDVCRVRRERTSTPLEAFVLMNGPQFVEAARVLGQRIMKRNAGDDTAALAVVFRTLTARHPSDSESEIIGRLFQQQLKYFTNHPDQAKKYLQNGDSPLDASLDAIRLAAVSAVANALFSFDEVVNRR